MKLARELEKRLERLADGLSAAIFRGKIHPVDIAARLVREADLRVVENSIGPLVPNRWVVKMHPDDVADEASDLLAVELTHTLEATAADRGWRLGGAANVYVATSERRRPGALAFTAESVLGDLPAWCQLLDVKTGTGHDIGDNRALVGRSEDADVRIRRTEVSRRHAILFREVGRTWVVDLGSANGTKVNSSPVKEDATPVQPGDTLTFGPATFAFRLQ